MDPPSVSAGMNSRSERRIRSRYRSPKLAGSFSDEKRRSPAAPTRKSTRKPRSWMLVHMSQIDRQFALLDALLVSVTRTSTQARFDECDGLEQSTHRIWCGPRFLTIRWSDGAATNARVPQPHPEHRPPPGGKQCTGSRVGSIAKTRRRRPSRGPPSCRRKRTPLPRGFLRA